jgi:hypothetical protein
VGLSIVTLAFMVKTGDLGGEISHPEIRAAGAPEVTAPPEGQEGLGFVLQSWTINNPWVFPMCETLHFTGLSLLVGVVILINGTQERALFGDSPVPAFRDLRFRHCDDLRYDHVQLEHPRLLTGARVFPKDVISRGRWCQRPLRHDL